MLAYYSQYVLLIKITACCNGLVQWNLKNADSTKNWNIRSKKDYKIW